MRPWKRLAMEGLQQKNNIHPGQTFNLDYSLMQILPLQKDPHTLLQFGLVGYGQRQTSNNSGAGLEPLLPPAKRDRGATDNASKTGIRICFILLLSLQ